LEFKLVIKTFTISITIFFLFYLTLVLLHIITIKDCTSYHYSVYAFWLAPFSALSILLAGYILSLKLNNFSLFFNKIAANVILTVFLFAAILFLEISVHYFNILIFLFIAFCLVIAAEVLLVRRILAQHNIHLNLKAVNSAILFGEQKIWMKDSINFASVHVVYNLILIADLLIIEWVHPSEHATGYYAAMLVIGNILWKFQGPLPCFWPQGSLRYWKRKVIRPYRK
jgi:hypothetical protein